MKKVITEGATEGEMPDADTGRKTKDAQKMHRKLALESLEWSKARTQNAKRHTWET